MNTKTYLVTAAILAGCGGGGSNSGNNGSTVPIDVVPLSASGSIELGPIAGGSVSFSTPNGSIIGTTTTGGDGVITYNPRDLVSKMGTASYIIARASGGQDIDADDDGVRDSVPTPVSGSFQMIIPRSTLERATPTGQSYQMVMNPVAGAISETILARSNAAITLGALDHIAREVGISDTDNNGVINYADVIGIQMKDITGVSSIVPAVSGYIRAIHTNDPTKKSTALKNIAKTENHLLASIVANPTATDHTPALRLDSVSGGTILYTLDGSSPIPGGSGTRSTVGTVTIPMQGATLYDREQFSLDGATVLGKVKRFDLRHDWTTLAQEAVPYNQTGRTTSSTESLTYKNTSYTITTLSNATSPGYTYPKTIDCRVGTTAGCHLGPYMAWSPAHESQIRSLITTGIQGHIDGAIVTPPVSLVDTVRSNIPYNGATYTIIDTWTLGPNNTKIFPVTITANITRRNGQSYTITKTATSQSELTNMNTQIEQEGKAYIDADTTPAPGIKTKNTLEIVQNWTNYRSSSYMIQVIWNTNGSMTTNYPTTVQGIYKSPQTGYNIEMNTVVNTDIERTNTINGLPAILKARIDSETIVVPTPTCTLNQEKRENYTNYRGAYYQSLTICNMSGTADYPMRVSAEYTLPGSSITYVTPQPSTVSNDSQRQTEINYHLSIARARIDAALDDIYPPGYTRTSPREYYGGGSYFFRVDYTTTVGKDFPANLYATITYQNGTVDNLVLAGSGLMDEGQITASMSSYAEYARSQIDNYNPTYSTNYIGSDGPYLHGTRGGDYTVKVQYNRTGQHKNYPVMIWIEYRMRSGGPLLDTRNIVGIGAKYAYSSTEKDQIKNTLIETVKGKMIASTGISPIQYAQDIGSRIGNMLISPAHAATPPSIVVKNNYASVPNFSYLSPDTVGGKFLAYNGSVLDHYVKKGNNSASVVGPTPAEIERKINDRILEELGKYEFGQTIYLGDIPENMRGAIGSVFVDLGKYIGNLSGLIQKHNTNLINAGVSQVTINNMWTKIDDIWSRSTAPLGEISSLDIALTVSTGGLVIKYIKTASGIIITKLISGPGAKEYLKYEASLLVASRGVGIGPGTVKLLSSAVTAEQLQILGVAKAIPGITRLSGGASLLYGSVDEGKVIFDTITHGWTTIYNYAGTITRVSADGISKLTYRTISSTPSIGGYSVTSVIETYKFVGGEFIKLSPWEVKFISPTTLLP